MSSYPCSVALVELQYLISGPYLSCTTVYSRDFRINERIQKTYPYLISRISFFSSHSDFYGYVTLLFSNQTLSLALALLIEFG